MTKYGVIITDVDEEFEQMEFHMNENDIFDTLPEAQICLKEYENNKEYQYQTFKVIEIYTGDKNE